jgi:hypothetical protein
VPGAKGASWARFGTGPKADLELESKLSGKVWGRMPELGDVVEVSDDERNLSGAHKSGL